MVKSLPIQSLYDRDSLERAEDHLVKEVIEFLKASVPGVQEGAPNLWEEICVGIQDDSSLSEMYLDHIRQVIEQVAAALPKDERVALWLGTEYGCWFREDHPNVSSIDDIPANDSEIANHFIQSLHYEAMNDKSAWVNEMMGY